MTRPAGIGLRVKTARAIVVVVAGSVDEPEIVERSELRLHDPGVAASAQPFHAGLDRSEDEARPIVQRACEAVHAVSTSALAALCDALRGRRLELVGAGVVTSSDTDPDTLHNPHMRAHACEGRLFRDAVIEAADRYGLPSRIVLERSVLGEAADALGFDAADLKQSIAGLGRSVGAPWRADEKAACAAAWLALASAPTRKPRREGRTDRRRARDRRSSPA